MADTEQEPVYTIVWGPRIEHNGGPAPADALAAEPGCLRVILRNGSVFEGPAKNWTSGVSGWWQWRAFLCEFDIDIIAYQIGRRVDVTALMAQLDAALAENARLFEAAKELFEYTSYAEIVGGISFNREAIRQSCDALLPIFEEHENAQWEKWEADLLRKNHAALQEQANV